MPPRPVILAVVAFWLAMTGLLVYRDLGRLFRPGQCPDYTLMATDEASRHSGGVRWSVKKNGELAYRAESWVEYRETSPDPALRDTFELRAKLRTLPTPDGKTPERRVRSLIRLARNGELREVSGQLHQVVGEYELVIDILGTVRDGQLEPRWRVRAWAKDRDSPDRVFENRQPVIRQDEPLYQVELPFEALPFPERGLLLDPLHPPNRLDDLKPGRAWQMPLMADLLILEALGRSLEHGDVGQPLTFLQTAVPHLSGDNRGLVVVEARVLPETQRLPEAPSPPPQCWVVEASADRVFGRLWVQQTEGEREGLVLRQEVLLERDSGKDEWVFQREPG